MWNFNALGHRHRAAATRQSPPRRRPSRRMGLEPMEGRLMLSGSGLDFTIYGQSVPLTFAPADQPMTVATAPDGGLITIQYSVPGTAFDGDLRLSGTGLFGTAGDHLDSRGLVVSGTSSGTWVSVDSFINNDIGPVVFAPHAGTDVILSIQLPPREHLGSSGGPHEGGPISIDSIIASKELTEGVEAGERPVKNLVKETTEANDPSQELAAASAPEDRAVSAEWARAIVFEMAGGEPVEARPRLGEGAGPAAAASSPLEHDLGAARLPAERAQTVPERSVPNGESSNAKFGGLDRPLLSAGPLDHPSDSAPLAWASRAAIHRTGEATTESSAFNIADSAYAEAFEQLIESERANTHWLAHYSRRALSVTPLLLVLALERVAARKSRRAGRLAASNAPSLPRRSSGFADHALPRR